MKKQNFLLIGFVLFISLFVGLSFSANSSSSVASDVRSGPNFINQYTEGPNSAMIQGSCTGVGCPLPNSLTNGTL